MVAAVSVFKERGTCSCAKLEMRYRFFVNIRRGCHIVPDYRVCQFTTRCANALFED